MAITKLHLCRQCRQAEIIDTSSLSNLHGLIIIMTIKKIRNYQHNNFKLPNLSFEVFFDSVLGTANLFRNLLHFIPQPQIPQNSKGQSATANLRYLSGNSLHFRNRKWLFTFAKLNRKLWCYFVMFLKIEETYISNDQWRR